MNNTSKNKNGELVKAKVSKNTIELFVCKDQEALCKATQNKFDINEQLAALMEQVEKISKELNIDLVPRFVEQLKTRELILNQHNNEKNSRKKLFGE